MIFVSWRGVHPNLVDDGRDHHLVAANRYQAHLAIVHQIGADDITTKDLPAMTIMLENPQIRGKITLLMRKGPYLDYIQE